jgi:hypothetical protein
VHVVWHQVAFQNLAFLLRSQSPKHLSHPLAQLSVQRLFRYFGMNTTWYLQSHMVWFSLS